VLLTAREVERAVEDLLHEPAFVIDIETTKARPRLNELLWVGLGAAGRTYLIPCGHPKGLLERPEHKERTPACVLFPNDDRGLTKGGKPSMRMVEHTVPAVYGPRPEQLNAREVCDIIQPLLWSDAAKIGHNVKFDLMSLAKYFGHVIPPGPYHDTIVLRHCLAEDLDQYDLKTLTCEWFKIHWKKRQAFYPNLGDKGIENFGLDEVARYLSKDLRYCWMMFQAFSPMLARRGVQDVYDFEMSIYPVIMDMEYEGFPVDLSKLELVRAYLQDTIAEVEAKVWRLSGDKFMLSNTEAKRWVMFGEGVPVYGESKRQLRSQKLKVRDRTKETKKPAITQAVLEYYSDRGKDLATWLLEWSALEKLRGTFIEGLSSHLRYPPKGLPTIHTSFKQHGTVTGRLSASEPNLQQLPRGTLIRDLFVADEGYTLIVADYDQVELRCAGWASQDPEMLRVFKDGQDIHALAASAMLQIPVEEVTKDQRQVGKTQNFGTLYGAGPEKIAQVAGVNVRRAEQFIANYFNMFYGLEEWKAEELALARSRGDKADPLVRPPYVAIPPNGRRRRLPDLYHIDNWLRWRAERQAINAYVQGFASNITKLAMRELHPQLEPYGAKMVAQVHDEIVVRVASEASEEVLHLVESVMGDVRNPEGTPILGEIPLVASASMGRSWAEAKG
jgi:DNA polymerase-1